MGIFLMFPHREDEFRRVGILVMKTPDPSQCLSAFEVERTNTRQAPGFGPLLYDIAMEIAGEEGIMGDRMLVSDDAERVWRFYLNSRPDVKAIQLDRNYPEQFTDTEEDDCPQGAFDYVYQKSLSTSLDWEDIDTDTQEYKTMFLAHPMTKKYIKLGGTPVLDDLQLQKRIIYK